LINIAGRGGVALYPADGFWTGHGWIIQII
jgi:hypothetical protein